MRCCVLTEDSDLVARGCRTSPQRDALRQPRTFAGMIRAMASASVASARLPRWSRAGDRRGGCAHDVPGVEHVAPSLCGPASAPALGRALAEHGRDGRAEGCARRGHVFRRASDEATAVAGQGGDVGEALSTRRGRPGSAALASG